MKCCDSGLKRRKKAVKMLYDYVNIEYDNNNKNFIVLGDWNDDLKDKPEEHCFDPFLNDQVIDELMAEIENKKLI